MLLGSSMLDTAGRGASVQEVPSEPALLGLWVRWQSLLGNPLTFSNLERTEITAF